jgi:hypothetical protein
MLKSRQTGLSFLMAAEALALAHLKREHTASSSLPLDDATRRSATPTCSTRACPRSGRRSGSPTTRPRSSSRTAGRRTRLISLPCREPRGKGKADVYLDEMPFMRQPRKIYTAAVPIISRGGGTLTLGSTPLGKNDPFYEIMTGRRS